jgi:predicted phage-related endonuclease
MNNRTINKPPHGSSEWLAVRWRDENNLARISASVAAAVHGSHPYTSGADLAVELLSDTPPTPQSENRAMMRGNTLEVPIRDWASRLLDKWLGAPAVMYVYEEEGVRLIATLDAVSEDKEVFEIKTMRGRWNGKLSDHWYWQGVQQAICANVDKITWVIFDSDLDIQFHEQVVTSDEKRMHIEACRQFLAAIDMGMVPDTASMNYTNVNDLFPRGNGTIKELDEEHAVLLYNYGKLQGSIAELEKICEEIKTKLCMAMGDADYGHVDGDLACTWKTATRTTFDSKKFELEHPALAAKFKKQTTYRTFRVVSKKGE